MLRDMAYWITTVKKCFYRAPDKLRCCGSCVHASVLGSLWVISVGLSALKKNLKHSSSAKGRCNRSHYANVCFVVL